jgi:site-specific recombinase XerC
MTVVKSDPWRTLWASFDRELGPTAAIATRTTYGAAGERFHAYLIAQGVPADPVAVTKAHVVGFLNELREEGAKPNTIRARFAALRRFFGWCVAEGELKRSPMEGLSGPKVDEPPAEVMTEDEVARLLAACRGQDFYARRDTAMIRLMIDTGMRRGEVAGILLGNVDLDGQAIAITGKGGRAGVVFFGVRSTRDLDRYLRARSRHKYADLPQLFVGPRGRISGAAVNDTIKRRARRAGLSDRIHAHLTRHTWAHLMKESTGSDEVVMTLGRWKDPRVMARYGAAAALQRAREAHRRHSPGDRI